MKAAAVARVIARLGVVVFVLVILAVVGTQYARILGRNVALAHELGEVRRDVAHLEGERTRKARDIQRLQNDAGAVPEIHEELRLVGDKEAIIYVKRAGEHREAP